MSLIGWYYQHKNGDLIYKREMGDTAADLRETPFAVMLWPVDPEDRAGAWRICVEALACGAKPERVKELAEKWQCDDQDAKVYADYLGMKLTMDGDHWCATRGDFIDLQASPAGFGKTALEAFAELCKVLNFKPAKMWGSTFADLVRV
jgi:hypothetical protein